MWSDDLRQIFESAYGHADQLTVLIVCGARKLRLTIPPKEPPKGSDIDVAILRAAAQLTEPVTPQKLARLAGYRFNSYFRDAVTRLVRTHQLIRTADGLASAN